MNSASYGTGPLTKRHNSYPWEFQQNYEDIVNEEFQHVFNLNFRVLVRGIKVVFNKAVFLMTDH